MSNDLNQSPAAPPGDPGATAEGEPVQHGCNCVTLVMLLAMMGGALTGIGFGLKLAPRIPFRAPEVVKNIVCALGGGIGGALAGFLAAVLTVIVVGLIAIPLAALEEGGKRRRERRNGPTATEDPGAERK